MAKRRQLTPLQKAQKRVRDEISRQQRKAEREGFEIITGLTWAQIKKLADLEALQTVTARTIRRSFIVTKPDEYISGYYEDVRNKSAKQLVQPMTDKVMERIGEYIDSLAPQEKVEATEQYIVQHKDSEKFSKSLDLRLRFELLSILDREIYKNGIEETAKRLDRIDWKNIIDALFDESNGWRAVTQGTKEFSELLSSTPLPEKFTRTAAELDERREVYNLPHAIDLDDYYDEEY